MREFFMPTATRIEERDSRRTKFPGDASTPRAQRLRSFTTIVLAAFVEVLPLMVWRVAVSQHDVRFHIPSWLNLASHWHEGTLQAHWASFANLGFGDPRFDFYPPLPMVLGGAITFLSSLRVASIMVPFVALVLAGYAMLVFTREFLPGHHARWAAAVYVLNPYFWMVIHFRFAVAELVAAGLFPLVALFCYRAARGSFRDVALLAASVGAIWISDIPASLIMVYTVAITAVVIATAKRSWRPLLMIGAGGVLGTVLAGFYLLPAWLETSLIHGTGLLDYRFDRYFLGYYTPENFKFDLTITVIAAAEAAIGVIALRRLFLYRRKLDVRAVPIVALMGGVAVFFMLPVSRPLWKVLPEAAYIQFPWRWLFVLMFSTTCLVTFLVAGTQDRKQTRYAKTAVWFVIVLTAFFAIRNDVRGRDTRIQNLEAWSTHTAPFLGPHEYLPATASDSFVLHASIPLAGADNGCGDVRVVEWASERKRLDVAASRPCRLTLRLFAYPRWQVTINGTPVRTGATDFGAMTVDVPAGQNKVAVNFSRTSHSWPGWLLTAVTALLLSGKQRNLPLDAVA